MKQRNSSPPMHLQRFSALVLTSLIAATVLAACGGTTTPPSQSNDAIHKIKHVIVITQENRSFDTYFGTYPGADGIPMQNGVPTVCVNDPQTKQCVKPYHDSQDPNHGGPHGQVNATADIDGGKMDAFINQAQRGKKSCTDPNDPACRGNGSTAVMGYHDAREIPDHWFYAQTFVLQVHLL